MLARLHLHRSEPSRVAYICVGAVLLHLELRCDLVQLPLKLALLAVGRLRWHSALTLAAASLSRCLLVGYRWQHPSQLLPHIHIALRAVPGHNCRCRRHCRRGCRCFEGTRGGRR